MAVARNSPTWPDTLFQHAHGFQSAPRAAVQLFREIAIERGAGSKQ
jgi:hypothetical protein